MNAVVNVAKRGGRKTSEQGLYATDNLSISGLRGCERALNSSIHVPILTI